MKSSQQKPETNSPAVIISSIGVLQFKEKHSNGKTTSQEVLPRINGTSISISDDSVEASVIVSDLTDRKSLSISSTFAAGSRLFSPESPGSEDYRCTAISPLNRRGGQKRSPVGKSGRGMALIEPERFGANRFLKQGAVVQSGALD